MRQLCSPKRSRSDAFWARFSAINGLNHQERSIESIRTGSYAYTLPSLSAAEPAVSRQALEHEEASPEDPHTEERAREARERDGWPQRGVADRRRFSRGSTRPGDDAAHR